MGPWMTKQFPKKGKTDTENNKVGEKRVKIEQQAYPTTALCCIVRKKETGQKHHA